LRILYFAPIDYNAIKQRPQHFADALSDSYDFFYIQPFGLRTIKAKDFSRLLSRIAHLYSIFSHKKTVPTHVKSLFFIPVVSEMFDRINVHLIKKQIVRLLDQETIFWITTPSSLFPKLLNCFPQIPIIYEMMDDYGMVQPCNKRKIDKTEKYIISRSRYTIVTAGALLEKARNISANAESCRLVGNGVSSQFFDRAEYYTPPEPCFHNGKKTVGYIGATEWWLDIELIHSLAKKFPQVNFVLVGWPKIADIPESANVFFIGKRPFESMPDYLNAFDVCIIPFKPGEFADSINPVKLYEYFALGKPVVSYQMKELEPYQNILYLALNSREFAAHLETALNEHDLEKIARRKKIASENTWDSKIQTVKKILGGLKHDRDGK